jgi:hypothetical protein
LVCIYDQALKDKNNGNVWNGLDRFDDRCSGVNILVLSFWALIAGRGKSIPFALYRANAQNMDRRPLAGPVSILSM